MSDLSNRNAKAQQQAIESFEARIRELEVRMDTLTGSVQNALNLLTELQKSNTLALQKLLGTGSTVHGHIN